MEMGFIFLGISSRKTEMTITINASRVINFIEFRFFNNMPVNSYGF